MSAIDDIRNMIATRLMERDWAAMRRAPVEDRREEGTIAYTPLGIAAGSRDLERVGQSNDVPYVYPPVTPLSIDAGSSDLDREQALNMYRRRVAQ